MQEAIDAWEGEGGGLRQELKRRSYPGSYLLEVARLLQRKRC